MRAFVALCIFIFLYACTSSDRTIPSDVIPLNEMKLLVWDMMQAGELADVYKENDTTEILDTTTQIYKQVLTLHKTDKQKFYNSFAYYEDHPLLNKQLFDSVLAYGNRQREGRFKKRMQLPGPK